MDWTLNGWEAESLQLAVMKSFRDERMYHSICWEGQEIVDISREEAQGKIQ